MLTKELEISKTLIDLGMTPSLGGYFYLKSAIDRTMHYRSISPVKVSTMVLYQEVADEFRTTPSAVERACRYSLQNGWPYRNLEKSKEVFGNKTEVPTPGGFIRAVAEYRRLCGEAENGT